MPQALPSQIRKNYKHLSEVLSLQIKHAQLEKLRKKQGGRVKSLEYQVDTQAISAGIELMATTVAEFSERLHGFH